MAGADAPTIEQSVATPIEQQMSSVARHRGGPEKFGKKSSAVIGKRKRGQPIEWFIFHLKSNSELGKDLHASQDSNG
jgi:hypothetical protein